MQLLPRAAPTFPLSRSSKMVEAPASTRSTWRPGTWRATSAKGLMRIDDEIDGVIAIPSDATFFRLYSFAFVRAASMAPKVRWSIGSISLPRSVSCVSCLSLKTSGPPNSYSSFWMAFVSAGWVTLHYSAALVKFIDLASATKYRT
jgi:hypothetical protein